YSRLASICLESDVAHFYPPVSRFLSIVFALVVSDVVQGAFRHEIQLQFEGVSGDVALSNACLASMILYALL
ncbi:hypothetical protein EV363DRAFT_645130, partial [Boletus edulis]